MIDDSCKITSDVIRKLIPDKLPKKISVLFGAGFGHVFPMIFSDRRKTGINAIDLLIFAIINH